MKRLGVLLAILAIAGIALVLDWQAGADEEPYADEHVSSAFISGEDTSHSPNAQE